MVEFIPAADLKKEFDVYGHFYSVRLTRKIRLECRSVLEIAAKKSVPSSPNRLSEHEPDAIFVMMNPGSSQPLVEVDYLLDTDEIAHLQISLVPTKPDTTQYQVMRIMRLMSWKHVRVLNLSDVRSPKSPEFFKQFHEL